MHKSTQNYYRFSQNCRKLRQKGSGRQCLWAGTQNEPTTLCIITPQHNDIKHNDTQHQGFQHNDIQHNDIQA